MATARQIAANRANAKKSTGPRTPEGKAIVARSRGPKTAAGKARSRWNALKHGLRARTLIPEPLLARESPAEFAALHESLCAQFSPSTPWAEALVQSLAQSRWRLNRLVRLEVEGFGTLEDESDLPAEAFLFLRYEARLRRQIESALDLLQRIPPDPGVAAGPPSPGPTEHAVSTERSQIPAGDRVPPDMRFLPNEPKPIHAHSSTQPGPGQEPRASSPGMRFPPNEPKPIHAGRGAAPDTHSLANEPKPTRARRRRRRPRKRRRRGQTANAGLRRVFPANRDPSTLGLAAQFVACSPLMRTAR